jgi:hypothetical protein
MQKTHQLVKACPFFPFRLREADFLSTETTTQSESYTPTLEIDVTVRERTGAHARVAKPTSGRDKKNSTQTNSTHFENFEFFLAYSRLDDNSSHCVDQRCSLLSLTSLFGKLQKKVVKKLKMIINDVVLKKSYTGVSKKGGNFWIFE